MTKMGGGIYKNPNSGFEIRYDGIDGYVLCLEGTEVLIPSITWAYLNRANEFEAKKILKRLIESRKFVSTGVNGVSLDAIFSAIKAREKARALEERLV